MITARINKQRQIMKTFLVQTLIFVSVIALITLIREADMLETGTTSQAPSINLETLSGAIQHVSFSKDSPKTLVYFFAPWCGVCRMSISNLESIYQSKDDVRIVVVALDFESIQDVRSFSSDLELTMPILLGDQKTKSDFQIIGYPSYYIIDEQGQVSAKSMGYSTEIGMLARLAL